MARSPFLIVIIARLALLLMALLITSAALCAGAHDTQANRSDMGPRVTEYEAHYQRLDGDGQYPFGFRPDLPEIQTDLSVMFFGSKQAGKSRLVERLLRARPGELSGMPTSKAELYVKPLPNAILYAADSVGFAHHRRTGFNPVLEPCNQVLEAKTPLKRIYYVVDVSDQDGFASVRRNLEFLKAALGPKAAAQIRLVVNKCDLVASYGRKFFERYGVELRHLFNVVFNESSPVILYVSAQECIGQLYDDIALGAAQPAIPLTLEDCTQSPGTPSLSDSYESPTTADLSEGDVRVDDGEAGIISCERDVGPLTDQNPAEADYPALGRPDSDKRQPMALHQEDVQSAAVHPGSGVLIASSMLISAILVSICA